MTAVSFQLAGLPWWLVLPAAGGAAWAIGRLARRELAGQPAGLTWLRRSIIALVTLLLLDPTITRIAKESELPTVAVVLDRSGSMAVDDAHMSATARLDEAVALDLVPGDLRPDGPRRVAAALSDAAETCSSAAQAIAALDEAWSRGTAGPNARPVRTRIAVLLGRLKELASAAASLPDMSEAFAAVQVPLQDAMQVLIATRGSDLPPQRQPSILAKALVDAAGRARRDVAAAAAAQGAADNALTAGAEAASPVATGLARLAAMSRAARAERLAIQAIVPELSERARVEVYALGDTTISETGGLMRLAADARSPAEPAGATDYAAPLSWLSRHWTARHVGGVILLGDGRQTSGADPVPVVRALTARGARVFGVLVGDAQSPRDAVIAEVNGPTEISTGESVHLDVRLRITGYVDRDFALLVAHAGRDVARRSVRGDGGWQVERFVVPWKEFAEGLTAPYTFTVRIESVSGDSAGATEPEASLANNQAECTVGVSQGPLRVLVVDAQPRWELRHLVAAIEADKRVELTRRFASVRFVAGDRELLPATQAGLDAFDLVVLGDLAPRDLSADDQLRLESFVRHRGGFLIAVAGAEGMPWSYSLGGLADTLPVRVTGPAPGNRQPIGTRLTVAGAAHPIMSILDDAALNQRMWSALPRLEWVASAVTAKSGVEVLLTTSDDAATPIVVVSQHGAGRVLWLGSDDCWRWRDGLGDRVYQTFWIQAMHWGLGVRKLAVRRPLGVEGLDLGADRAGLQRIAAASGGRVVGMGEARGLARDFAATLEPRVSERRATFSLSQNYVALLLVVGGLLGEWMWRKRRGLP